MLLWDKIRKFLSPSSLQKKSSRDEDWHVHEREFYLQRQLSLEYLYQAYALIEAGWCQIYWAIDANGNPCLPDDAEAKFFSLCGAIYRVQEEAFLRPTDARGHYFDFFWRLFGANKCQSLDKFNDENGRTKEEVLALIDKAIYNCK